MIVRGASVREQLVCKYMLIISKSCSNEFINYEVLDALRLFVFTICIYHFYVRFEFVFDGIYVTKVV